jgi:hypothetical protein
MALKGMGNKSVKEALKTNQLILAGTKYNKEVTQQTNKTAKASPSIEELQNGQK